MVSGGQVQGVAGEDARLYVHEATLCCVMCVCRSQAYSKFGVLQGTVLTAWRLLRCNPLVGMYVGGWGGGGLRIGGV